MARSRSNGDDHRPGALTPARRSEDELIAAALRQESAPHSSPRTSPCSVDGVGLPAVSALPERVGPYRILRQVGAGGMGVVYEAEQERPLRRRVALKVIKLGMDTREVVRRFEA